MIVKINGNSLTVDSIYEHVEKNQFIASYKVPDEEPFPDVSFMANLRWMESFEVKNEDGSDIPVACEYNYISDFTTNFTLASRSYSMSLTYMEVSDETDAE